LVKKARRKLPRNAVETLMYACEMLSEEWGKPATEIFKGFLELMNKYADYFFSKPWPEKYDYAEATTFTDEDVDFLFEGIKNELLDRYTTICLKKNMNMEIGFMGYFGIYWTQKAFDERFFRPCYKPVLEAFEKYAQENKDAREVLGNLKKQFDAYLIHSSLVDLLEHEYPREVTRKLIEEIFQLLHTVKRLKPCGNFACDWYRSQKYPELKDSG
jgi:hypothetical protein